MTTPTRSLPAATTSRAARSLLLAVAAETVIVIAHFAHGAHVYDDPSRLHVVGPAIVNLVLVVALTALAVWRPHKATLVALVAAIAPLYLATFGLFHGGYSHLLKDMFWLAGASKDTLEQHFMNPDYAFPDDAVFEVGGVLTLVAAAFVANALTRFVRQAWAADRPNGAQAGGERI